ncbi:hypothetical protein Ancab_037186 [Ancistrocladus abbreviatus]
MASPPFPVEDQTDADFFDKLVEDEGEGGGSVHSFIEHALSDENVESDSVSSIEGSHGDKGAGDGVASCSGNLESPSANQSGTPGSSKSDGSGSVIEYGGHDVGASGAFDLKVSRDSENAGRGVKEVQWSAFNSDSQFNSGTGDASYSDFFNEIGHTLADPSRESSSSFVVESDSMAGVCSNLADNSSSKSCVQNDGNQNQALSADHNTGVQDLNSSQYWENLYPGWRYDQNTGQWYQLESSDAVPSTRENTESTVGGLISGQHSDAYYLQQTPQAVVGGVSDGSTTGNVSYWNQTSHESAEYPAHMVFDPQYPGWYYDTIAQEWKSLDSYTTSTNKLSSSDHGQQTQNGSVSTDAYYSEQSYIGHGETDQVHSYHQHQDQLVNWGGFINNYKDPNMKGWEADPHAKSQAVNFTENMQSGNGYVSNGHANNSTDYRGIVSVPATNTLYEQASQGVERSNGFARFQSFSPSENMLQHHNPHNMEVHHQMQLSPSQFNGPKLLNISEQPLQSSSLFPCAPIEGRSSAGRPPHALVTFGFGGKLIVMKDNGPFLAKSSYGSQDAAGGVINMLNMMEVAMPTNDGSDVGLGAYGYFHTLYQQSFPGPLVSGNVGSKELNKWIDDKLANCETLDRDYGRVHVCRMLLSLLKIACQYYGKLRSPFGTDHVLKESDCPESALAKLFVSAKRSSGQFTGPSSLTQCLQNLPSEGQIQATALEVQKLLVSGRRIEALQCAQEGQLWGPAIVIAAQLGDQFYGDTVKQMALHQLNAGCPLRTLCLLIAGQLAEVFPNSTTNISQPGALNVSQPAQNGANFMLDEWEENLAIITSNRTKGDELVITHLGDCLWREKDEVAAAHICYLVAEANIEHYSDSARLCLIGADHLKCPRTYASPDAIQRTEVYEYAKVLGNSQFILLPFQPYKLLYAYMLADVGKLSDSLKYCQAILKSLKTGRIPEVDALKNLVSSLEERIKVHQQGGHAANLAPAKLVGKLLNFFDSTAHRVVGGPPSPVSAMPHSDSQRIVHDHQSRGTRVSTSQSTMAMSSLVPSASSEPMNEWTGSNNRKILHNRSISEPDIGRIPRKVDSAEQSSSTPSQDNSASTGSSRFGRIGSQLFQKTFGLVLRSRSDRQAKLGEKNRFYYDEKLKRWVEEGAEPPAEEAALLPPPTAAALINGFPDHNMKDESRNNSLHIKGEPEFRSANSAEKSTGMPPIPPGSNQFSGRGRGVRARYVDTFNKGGAPVNVFQSPSVPITKATGVGAKFFIPTPLSAGQDNSQSAKSTQEAVAPAENSTEPINSNASSPPQMPMPPVVIQRYPSMDNMVNNRVSMTANGNDNLLPHSRRTASWGGSLGDSVDFVKVPEARPLGEALGFPQSTYMPNDHSGIQFPASGVTAGEDLQEVEL